MTPHLLIASSPRGARLRSLCATLLVGLLLATGLVVAQGPAPAQAALHNIEPTGPDGLIQEEFYADGILYARFTSDIQGGYVCIVEADVTDPSTQSCDTPAWGSPNFVSIVGTNLGYVIEGPMLKIGTWRLMVGAPGSKVGTLLSRPFTVLPCRGTCDTAPAEQILAQWKAQAALRGSAATGMCYAAKVATLADAVRSGRGLGKKIDSTWGAWAAGGTWGAVNYFVPTSSYAFALAMLTDISCGLKQTYHDISEDPPDPNYAEVAQPEIRDLPITGDAAYDALIAAYERADAHGVASRIAFERYQGALAAGDTDAAGIQASATAEFTAEVVLALREAQVRHGAVESKSDLADPISTAEDLLEASAYADRVATDGLSAEEITQLTDLGFSPEGIEEIGASVADLDVSGVDPDATMRTVLVGMRAGLDATIDAFDHFGRSLSSVAAELGDYQAPNQPPVASLTATPTSGTAPLTVALTSTSTDPDGDDLTITWDIPGAGPLTGQAIEHTFTEPGIYTLVMTADDGDRWSQATATITVAPPVSQNRAPVASYTADVTSGTAPLTVTFTSTSTDPDGDELTYHWDIAGEEELTGETVSHTFTEPGYFEVVHWVLDPAGAGDDVKQLIAVAPPGADNLPPVASFTTDPASGTAPLTVALTSTSTDPDGDDLTFEWDIAGLASATGESAEHTFTEPGIYQIVLTARDEFSYAQALRTVTVTAPSPQNRPPVAAFELSASSGLAPLTVTATDGSSDPDGDVLTRRWRVSDGTEETGPSTLTRTFTTPGTYTFVLEVSDGRETSTVSRQVVVHAPELAADIGVGTPLDAVHAVSGGRLVSATSEANTTNYAATNLLYPGGSSWRSAGGEVTDEEIVFALAGDGREIIEKVVLDPGTTGTTLVRDFDVAISTTGTAAADFTVVTSGALERVNTPQEFAFEAQHARFLRLRFHTNHGSTSTMQLRGVSAPTRDRAGGLVSLRVGPAATVVAASSGEESAAGPITRSTSDYWRSDSGQLTDQWLRYELGAEGPQTISAARLRGTTSTTSARDVTLAVSDTGEPGTFEVVAAGSLERVTTAQELTFAPVTTRFVELRIANNHGSGSYIQLSGLEVLTTDGLDVADGDGVGAGIVSATSEANATSYPAVNLLDGTTSTWRTTSGGVTDEAVTLVLRGGQTHEIDRIRLNQTANNGAKHVEVATSTDGADFTVVTEAGLVNAAGDQWVTFAPTEARFLRLRVLEGYNAGYVSLRELAVYATDRGGPEVPFIDATRGGASPVTAWLWDFGDGTTSTEQHPRHTFPGAGGYDVRLTVSTIGGESDTAAHRYVVVDPPRVQIVPTGGATTVNEQASVALRAETLGVAVQDWQWDLDYTQPSTTANTVTARFPDDGTYTVTLRGRSEGLWTEPATLEFTVLNVAPSVNAGAAATVYAGVPFTPASTVTDPADIPSCTWDWGDGSDPESVEDCRSTRSRLPHVYELPGTYTATLTADDGDGGVTEARTTVTVNPRPSFAHFTTVSHGTDGTRVVARLLDGLGTTAIAGAPVSIGLVGQAAVATVTDAEGYAGVLLERAAGDAEVTLDFAGSVLHEPTSVTRVVDAPIADIVFVVDESASMGSYQQAVQDNVRFISQHLGSDLDFRLGLVGYAGGYNNGYGRILTPLDGDLSVFSDAVSELRISTASANAFEGVSVGMGEEMAFRSRAATCVVVISDASASELSAAVPKTTKEEAMTALASQNATLFGILTLDGISQENYGVPGGMAGLTGGDVWPIGSFGTNAEAVLDGLVTKCVTIAQVPDLALSKTTGAGTVTGGDEVTYELTAANVAATPLTGVTISDTLPAGVRFLSASDGGTYDPASREVTWPPLALQADDSAVRTLTVAVESAGFDPGEHEIVNEAVAVDDGTRGADGDPSNNTASAAFTMQVAAPEPDVGLSKTADVDEVAAAETITYTLRATNHGTAPLTGVVLTDDLPAGLAFVDASGDGAPVAGSIVWPPVDLGVGEEVERTITARVDAGAFSPGRHTVTNTATVTDDGASGADVDPADNSASAAVDVVIVERPAVLEVTKEVTSLTDLGEGAWRIGYRIVVSADADGGDGLVTLRDDLDFGAGISVVEATWAAGDEEGTFSGATTELIEGEVLAAGEERTVDVTVEAIARFDAEDTWTCREGETSAFRNIAVLTTAAGEQAAAACAEPAKPEDPEAPPPPTDPEPEPSPAPPAVPSPDPDDEPEPGNEPEPVTRPELAPSPEALPALAATGQAVGMEMLALLTLAAAGLGLLRQARWRRP